jgi:hypothetical protein
VVILNDFFTFAEIPDYTWFLADLRNIVGYDLSTKRQIGV